MFSESLRAFLKPVAAYLDDPAVTEIMINGPADVWIEKAGKLSKTAAVFTEEGLLAAARNLSQFVGRPLSEERPRLDARLPDGSRVHVVLAPLARKGTTVAIRKFARDKLSIDSLLTAGALSPRMARLLDAMVGARLNIVVSGGTGSGKTTLLNIVSRFIPDEERIVTLEDAAELQLQQPHIVSLEARPPDKNGKGAIDIGELLHSSLRLRPDRIVVGEVRGGEAFHLLQAMNTGHAGSLTTVHANTPIDTLRKLEALCLMSDVGLPLVAVRASVASAIQAVVCCERFRDGTRKLTHIAEVLPLDAHGEYRIQNLFSFVPSSRDDDGHIHGAHVPSGVAPTFLQQLQLAGYAEMTPAFFEPATPETIAKKTETAKAVYAEPSTQVTKNPLLGK